MECKRTTPACYMQLAKVMLECSLFSLKEEKEPPSFHDDVCWYGAGCWYLHSLCHLISKSTRFEP